MTSDLHVVRESAPGELVLVDTWLESDRAADVADRARREHPGQDIEVMSHSALELVTLSSNYELEK